MFLLPVINLVDSDPPLKAMVSNCLPECDISVSKLLGFKPFHYFDGIGIGFEKFWYRKKYRYRFRKKLVLKKVSVSVSKKFGIEKSIGIGFEKIWYRKKYWYRFLKFLY